MKENVLRFYLRLNKESESKSENNGIESDTTFWISNQLIVVFFSNCLQVLCGLDWSSLKARWRTGGFLPFKGRTSKAVWLVSKPWGLFHTDIADKTLSQWLIWHPLVITYNGFKDKSTRTQILKPQTHNEDLDLEIVPLFHHRRTTKQEKHRWFYLTAAT